MAKHKTVYFEYFGYGEQDTIMCELCESRIAVDIMHIIPRSKFGKKRKNEQDDIKNLCAGCRECHRDFDDGRKWTTKEVQEIHLRNLKN